jgi:membrane-associated phospholipid phosphatase
MKAWERIVFSLFALAILAAIGIKLHDLDMPVARFVRSFDIDAVNYSGDFVAILGKGIVLAGLFLLIGLLGWWLKHEQLRDLGIRGLFAMAGVGAVSQSLKHLIGRPRPRFAHADEFFLGPSLDTGMDSFPSGHTINVFGAVTVVAWFVPVLRVPLFLIAGLVGLSRVIRGSHFPTDVFAGAVLGVLIGSLAAAGFRRWRDEALPGLLRTGVPLAVSVFLIAWVVLHPVPPWSWEVRYIGMGVALVLAGGLLGGLSAAYNGKESGLLRNAGQMAMILGVAVACGPWWAGLLLFVALMPMGLLRLRQEALAMTSLPPFWKTLPAWGREAGAVGTALVAIAAIRSLKGLIPLG